MNHCQGDTHVIRFRQNDWTSSETTWVLADRACMCGYWTVYDYDGEGRFKLSHVRQEGW